VNEIPLFDLVTVSVGAPRVDNEGWDNTVGFLQATDIDQFGRLLLDAPKSRTALTEGQLERAWIQADDVLLVNKGTRNVAAFYRSDYPRAVASGAFYILRVNDAVTILPEFLACYLNLPTTQNQLQKRIVSASTVLSLNKKDLLDLPIPVLSLAVQQQLIDLHNSFSDIYDNTQQQLNLQQALLYQCFSTTLQTHR